MSRQAPLLTALICTCCSPDRVGTAVQSVLAQTLEDLEILVIVDGPDESTLNVLGRFDDPRLRVSVLPSRGGVRQARNAGLDLALDPWVAFLDDDDGWPPSKLERRLAAARESPHRYPILASRFVAPEGQSEFIWPLLSEAVRGARRSSPGLTVHLASSLLPPGLRVGIAGVFPRRSGPCA